MLDAILIAKSRIEFLLLVLKARTSFCSLLVTSGLILGAEVLHKSRLIKNFYDGELVLSMRMSAVSNSIPSYKG